MKIPSMRTALIGLGEAAAEGGRDTWTAALTSTTALLATSGNFNASIAYSSVVGVFLVAALMKTFCRGGASGCGALSARRTNQGGADW